MSFLDKVRVIADKNKKRDLVKSIQKDLESKMLDQSRLALIDMLHKNYSVKSPAYLNALNTFRKRWYSFYGFNLRPEQEARYLEVLRDKSGEESAEKNK